MFRHRPIISPALNELGAALRSPQSRGLLFRVAGILAVFLAVWMLIVAFLSLFNAWFIVVLTIVLSAVVGVREYQKRRRENWILQGHCAACGYDLRATPDRCPECGRDAAADEPIWRRMRRELEAKLAKSAIEHEPIFVAPLPISEPSAESTPVPIIKRVMRTPDFDEGPIPLEPGFADKA